MPDQRLVVVAIAIPPPQSDATARPVSVRSPWGLRSRARPDCSQADDSSQLGLGARSAAVCGHAWTCWDNWVGIALPSVSVIVPAPLAIDLTASNGYLGPHLDLAGSRAYIPRPEARLLRPPAEGGGTELDWLEPDPADEPIYEF